MKLLFIHSSEKIKTDEDGNLYTDGSYNQKVWEIYLQVFDQITLIMRKDEHIYTTEEANSRFNIIPSDKIDVAYIPDTRRSINSVFSKKLKYEVYHTIENSIVQADAIIIRLPGTYKAVSLAKKCNKTCLVEVVGCPFDSLWNYSFKGKALALSSYRKMKKALKNADYAIYVTEHFLQNRYPTNGISIGCSDVQINEVPEMEVNSRIADISNSQKKKLIIGTAAGIGVRYKGQQYIIQALKILKDKGVEEFEYQIAGNGDSSYLLEQARKYNVEDKIVFVGSIPHDKIFDWYKSIDIYAQPSKQEGLPRALVEAMSCGTPCIGSNAGGIPELLPKEVIFKKGKVNELSEILLKMMDNEFRNSVATQCYDRSKDYDLDVLTKKRIDFMKDVFGAFL